MKSFWRQDLRRGFLNAGFFAGLLAVAWILVAGSFQSPLNRSRSSYHILADIYAASGFGPFAAIFPGLAYASVFCEEYTSGYLKMILSRMSWKKFGLIRMLSAALPGGLMLALPIAAACGIAFTCGIPGIPSGSDRGLLDGTVVYYYIEHYGEWYIFAGKVLLGFLFGCMWALAGLAFAVWMPNKYVALIGPFVLYEAMWLSLGTGRLMVLNPIYMWRGNDLNSYPLSVLMECIYILLAAAAVMLGLKRRCRNG